MRSAAVWPGAAGPARPPPSAPGCAAVKWQRSSRARSRSASSSARTLSSCRCRSSFSIRPRRGEGRLSTPGPRPTPCWLLAAAMPTTRRHQQPPRLRVAPSQQLLPPLTAQSGHSVCSRPGWASVASAPGPGPGTQSGWGRMACEVCPGPEQAPLLSAWQHRLPAGWGFVSLSALNGSAREELQDVTEIHLDWKTGGLLMGLLTQRNWPRKPSWGI